MIDALAAPAPVADRSLDLAVHAAAAVVTAYLRVSDRVGIVVLGGLLRWLAPASRRPPWPCAYGASTEPPSARP